MPLYGDGVSYRETFEIAEPSGSYRVKLPRWNGSVARVVVNGRHGGYIESPPYERNVTAFVRSGRNTIEVTVIGTLKNTLGPHHAGPEVGAAWPGMFRRPPADGLPPGAAYATVSYGLMEPFVLVQERAAQ